MVRCDAQPITPDISNWSIIISGGWAWGPVKSGYVTFPTAIVSQDSTACGATTSKAEKQSGIYMSYVMET